MRCPDSLPSVALEQSGQECLGMSVTCASETVRRLFGQFPATYPSMRLESPCVAWCHQSVPRPYEYGRSATIEQRSCVE